MEVRLFATLRDKHGWKTSSAQWHEGVDGHALLNALGIAPDDVAIFLINGMHSQLDAPIKADDVIALFPPLGGG